MMKQMFLSALLCFCAAVTIQAQNPTICRLGFTYDISQSPNWGNGKPVITGIYPYSSAETVGLKTNDIIESIDGIQTAVTSAEEIAVLMNPAGKNEVSLVITNLTDSAKHLIVKKECKRRDAISEDQLASAFQMYSLESTSERSFICPFKTTTTTEPIDFSVFKTFAFTPVDEGNQKREETINGFLEKEFRKKGLTYDATNPDILIRTYYYNKRNPNYKPSATTDKQASYRYDITLNRMQKFPFLSHSTSETEAEYLLQLGIRLIDQKVNPGKVLWECEANEMLESGFRLENYAQTHIPLMCMQFPYAKYSRNVQFQVYQKTYNYTGINYDINRMEVVMSVDPNSPAHTAGVRARDVIDKIDNHSLSYSSEELTAAYKRFITNTMKYRDQNTIFTDLNGFQYCMFWDKFSYTQVAETIQNSKSIAPFSYLYKFAPYINPSSTNACTFQIKRGKEKVELVIRPTIHTEVMIEIK
ncbi:hypothetical protein M2459_002030 [Parabacteroides sp. PF5-5]|uniref:DUF4136 domain-containing protein n=1 Tax=unclassified Parabacteroides TaxID=2649774 RepID=UPI002475CB06|nr:MULTISPECIES: DUF4136 domain-containing protein [unclassified Parabacteroides]MDH6305561.1 hypothetical protein [Parabacteroides sp. PH5-39]MDH6316399.1 hypothetical protein [Parabacteroides sp. PF5-13]MDH6319884.1 hypothetical protein [Parabacteroides sp. PH5-13]MDH6323525.1 hypothetical protein [Parabacteroides sp. PH5-8]MDH6327586.1 hypothetical protein [Parabacteroides sp. PH5-41]